MATETTMTNLRQRTSSSIYIDDLDSDPDFDDVTFSLTRLSQGR